MTTMIITINPQNHEKKEAVNGIFLKLSCFDQILGYYYIQKYDVSP